MAAAMRRSVSMFGEKISQISSKLVLPEKLRGGRIEKAVNYLKLVRDDYKSALQDGVLDAKARPYKTAVYGAALGLTTTAIATNPSFEDFLDQRVEWCNEMALVGASVRNPVSEEHLKDVNRLLNESRLQRYDLIVCSLLVRESFDPECQLYPAQCSYLEPTYFELLTERLVDFGAFGRWWLIDRTMNEYDVNDAEIQSSTALRRF